MLTRLEKAAEEFLKMVDFKVDHVQTCSTTATQPGAMKMLGVANTKFCISA